MRERRWMLALIGLLTVGLLAAGCGSDDDTTSATTSTPTEAETTEATADGASARDVYDACISAIEGTAAEDAAKPQCEQVRDAYEECSRQAGELDDDEASADALQVCQKAADTAITSGESEG